MNVVDSPGWLEYFADEENASFFAVAIEDIEQLVVPVLSIYEVFKRIIQELNEDKGLQVVAIMQQGLLVDLDARLALSAAKLSASYKLPMAGSIILATARAYEATLWTQDVDFAQIEGVQYVAKQR